MTTILATLKEIVDAVKGVLDMANTVKANALVLGVQQKLLDLQEKLLAHRAACIELQEKYAAVLDERDALQKRLAEVEKFQAKADRFQLKALAPGFAAYVLKESAADGEPVQWLCKDCFEHGEIGTIQISPDDAFERGFPGERGITHLRCLRCGKKFTLQDALFDALWNKYA